MTYFSTSSTRAYLDYISDFGKAPPHTRGSCFFGCYDAAIPAPAYLVLAWIVVGLLVCGRDQPGLRGVGRLRPFGVIEYLVVVLRLLKILIRVPAFYKVSRALLLIILGSLIVFINLVLLSSLGLVVRFVRRVGIIPLVF